MFAAQLVETERIGEVVLIGINRPEKRNCVNKATADELVKAFADFENDDKLKVAVLHGKGEIYCSVSMRLSGQFKPESLQ